MPTLLLFANCSVERWRSVGEAEQKVCVWGGASSQEGAPLLGFPTTLPPRTERFISLESDSASVLTRRAAKLHSEDAGRALGASIFVLESC